MCGVLVFSLLVMRLSGASKYIGGKGGGEGHVCVKFRVIRSLP